MRVGTGGEGRDGGARVGTGGGARVGTGGEGRDGYNQLQREAHSGIDTRAIRTTVKHKTTKGTGG